MKLCHINRSGPVFLKHSVVTAVTMKLSVKIKIKLLNLSCESTLQWGTGRGLLCLVALVYSCLDVLYYFLFFSLYHSSYFGYHIYLLIYL